MNLGLWVGFVLAALLVGWGMTSSGTPGALLNRHGVLVVLGGTVAATLIAVPLRQLGSAFVRLGGLFLPSPLPSPEEAVAEIVRLARVAQTGGGILALQEEGRELAGGFPYRAISVAIATGESAETRRVLEREIKQTRIGRQEDANVFRTIGVLSPMFGILGTLLGMIEVLGSLSEPAKVGPAMALALSSAFLGIAIANFLCIPIAGQLRLTAMRETLVLEILLEGIVEIAAGKAPYVVELHLSSYLAQRRTDSEAGAGAPGPAAAGGRV